MQNKTNLSKDRIAYNHLKGVPAWDEEYRSVISDGDTVFNLISEMHDGQTEDHA